MLEHQHYSLLSPLQMCIGQNYMTCIKLILTVKQVNAISNPHLVDWFFTQRLESFIKHWLYESLGEKWHWFRYEYQGRGSIRCHGTAKLNNDPGMCQLTQIALKGFLAQKYKDQNDCSDTTELDEDVEALQRAAETVCQYDVCIATLSVCPHRASLKNMPGHGGIRTCDL